jgi:hypothetical protein
MAGRLADFLNRMSNAPVQSLPLVHTTPAYNLRQIVEEKQLRATQCDVFTGEKLCYFFFGRPAYKWETEADATDWELPVCFVFEYDTSNVKRVFPFDSGGFRNGKLPKYLSMMPLEEFEISQVPNSPSKFVGAYFSSVSDYLQLRPKPEPSFRETLSVANIESEVRALHKLYSENFPRSDDRRGTVELQFSENISFEKKKLLAIVFPDIYLSDKDLVRYAKENSISLLPYDVFPLNSSAYTGIIYSKVREFYKRRKFIR